MAVQSTTELRARAQQIRNETIAGANTAVRVGSLIDDFADSLDSITGHMWQHYKDNTYVVGNKFSVASGVRTKLTIDGVARTEVSPNGYTPIWDTVTNKIVPYKLEDFYTVRLDFAGWSDVAAVNHFNIEMDIGGVIGVVAADTGIFLKGGGIEQHFNFSSQFFVGTTFLANGAEIYITPEEDASFWNIGITISRTYTPMV